jgi:predicted LPLAT superfamily acyltransferase
VELIRPLQQEKMVVLGVVEPEKALAAAVLEILHRLLLLKEIMAAVVDLGRGRAAAAEEEQVPLGATAAQTEEPVVMAPHLPSPVFLLFMLVVGVVAHQLVGLPVLVEQVVAEQAELLLLLALLALQTLEVVVALVGLIQHLVLEQAAPASSFFAAQSLFRP